MSNFKIENNVLVKYEGYEKDVVIPDGVTEIGWEAFRWNSYIKTVTVPNSVTVINTFAFEGCRALESINIPKSVTTIESSVFDGCRALKSITIPSSVSKIGSYTFSGCASLESITIEDGVEMIDSNAFSNCMSLESIFFPKSVTSIGSGVFFHCTSLKRIDVDENNPAYKSLDGVLYSRDGKKIVCYPAERGDTEYIIPDGVTEIGWAVFSYCDSIRKIVVPSGVTKIGTGTFCDCDNLTTIVLPESVSEIGQNPFPDCKALCSIVLPSVVAFNMLSPESKRLCAAGYTETKNSGAYSDEAHAHYKKYIRAQKKKLLDEQLENPAVISYFTAESLIAFEDIDALVKKVKNPEVTAILLNYKGKNSTAKNIKKAAQIEERKVDIAFGAIPTLAEAKKEWGIKEITPSRTVSYIITKYKGEETDVFVPSKIGKGVVKRIGNKAFSGIKAPVKNVTIPDTVDIIAENAFRENTTIETVTILDGGDTFYIGPFAFKGCTSLKRIDLPKDTYDISTEAFRGCSNLETITIFDQEDLEIDERAFWGCKNLTIRTPQGSFADYFAKKHKIKVEYIDG